MNHIRKTYMLLLILITILSSLSVSTYAEDGKCFYVSNSGDDSNSGLSEATPWRTLGKVSQETFEPGDCILLKRGDTWHESLIISSSGTMDNPITYGSYGSGNKPQILGSKPLSTWESIGNHIWKSSEPVLDPSYGANHNGNTKGPGHMWPGGAWFELMDGSSVWGSQEKYLDNMDFSDLKKNLDWGWYNNHAYIYSTTDPNTTYKALQVSQRQYGIGFASHAPQDYVTIDGIEIMYCQSKGFASGYPAYEAYGLTIENCHIGYIGIKEAYASHGIYIFHSDVLIKNNEIHDTGRHGAFYCVYNKSHMTTKNVAFIGNHFYNGFHTTGLDIQNPDGHTYRNFLVKDNHFEGSQVHDLNGDDYVNTNLNYIVNLNGGTYKDFNFYNNLFTYSTGKGLALAGIDSVNIYHNTFYGVNPTLANYQGQLYFTDTITDVTVKNNLFYNTVYTSYNPYFISMKVNKWHFDEIESDNNLYYGEDPNTNLIGVADYGHYKKDEWTEYNNTTGWDIDSIVGIDPLLNKDYQVSVGSPAYGLAVMTDDYTHVNNHLGATLPRVPDTDIKVLLDGDYLTFDVDPIAENGRVLVPLRAIFESLGLSVGWDYKSQTVSGFKENLSIKLVLGDITASINDAPVILDVPAKVINQRTLVPLRFVSEATGATVTWDGDNRTVVIDQ